jgi:MATE family multidrug resistance protein
MQSFTFPGSLDRRYLSAQAVVQPLMVVTLLATLLTPLFLYIFVFK